MKYFLVCLTLVFGLFGSAYAQTGSLQVLGAKTDAQKWLTYLRDGTDMYDSFIEHVRGDVKEASLTLADIGTSEKELKDLRVKGCKTAAHKWLSHLRDGTDMYDSFIGYVHEEAQNCSLTIVDIGTSEKELKDLRVKGCKIAANKWLGYLRNGTDMHDALIGYVRKEAQKCSLTLADIGTSEKELGRMKGE